MGAGANTRRVLPQRGLMQENPSYEGSQHHSLCVVHDHTFTSVQTYAARRVLSFPK